MAQISSAAATGRVAFNWILDRRTDLVWYIGSALAGWLYVALIFLAVTLLPNPMQDAFGTVRLGGIHIPLTLQLLVYGSWAFLLDAPHLWSTLARTFLDPEERRQRRRELWLSWSWFLLGPALILLPYLLGALLRPAGITLPAGLYSLGAVIFVVFFRLWAYYHVVRQHWGFFRIYKRKNHDLEPAADRVDTWFFHLAFYLPLAMFLFGPVYAGTPGMPQLGLDRLAVGGLNLSALIYRFLWVLYAAGLLGYIGYQLRLWRQGRVLNGPKLLMLALLVPLHLLVFHNPWLAALVTPIVTVGHNLQYHRIVWMYGRNKYVQGPGTSAPLARAIFSRTWVYMAAGLLFTFALYRGPWIDWLQTTLGMNLDSSVLLGIGMMAGLRDPAELNLGQQLFGAFLLGWAMQHYYLDAQIWRVSRDRTVARQLRLESPST